MRNLQLVVLWALLLFVVRPVDAHGEVVSEVSTPCDSWLTLSPGDRYRVCLKEAAAKSVGEIGSIRALCGEAAGYIPGVDDELDALFTTARFLPSYRADATFGGLVVTEIRRGSLLDSFGLLDADVIVEINGIPLSRPSLASELARQLTRIPSGRIKVERAGRSQVLEFSQ